MTHSLLAGQVLAYQKSGDKLGWLRSTNESWTRVAIYVSLMALYVLGGQKVKLVSHCSLYMILPVAHRSYFLFTEVLSHIDFN